MFPKFDEVEEIRKSDDKALKIVIAKENSVVLKKGKQLGFIMKKNRNKFASHDLRTKCKQEKWLGDCRFAVGLTPQSFSYVRNSVKSAA